MEQKGNMFKKLKPCTSCTFVFERSRMLEMVGRGEEGGYEQLLAYKRSIMHYYLIYMLCKLSDSFPSYRSHETCVLGQMVGICLVHS